MTNVINNTRRTTTVLGHTITLRDSDITINDDNIELISQAIIDGASNDVIVQDGVEYDWDIESHETTYLLEKVAILEIDDKVVFEQGQLIYEVFLRDDGDYEYSYYNFEYFINGNSLEASDGGICTGSAKDSVYMAIA